MQSQDIDKTRHNVQYTQHLVLTLYGAARHGRRFLFRVVVVEVYYPALAGSLRVSSTEVLRRFFLKK